MGGVFKRPAMAVLACGPDASTRRSLLENGRLVAPRKLRFQGMPAGACFHQGSRVGPAGGSPRRRVTRDQLKSGKQKRRRCRRLAQRNATSCAGSRTHPPTGHGDALDMQRQQVQQRPQPRNKAIQGGAVMPSTTMRTCKRPSAPNFRAMPASASTPASLSATWAPGASSKSSTAQPRP